MHKVARLQINGEVLSIFGRARERGAHQTSRSPHESDAAGQMEGAVGAPRRVHAFRI